MKHILRKLLPLVLALALLCSLAPTALMDDDDDNEDNGGEESVAVTGLTLSSDALSDDGSLSIVEGYTVVLTVTVAPATATNKNVTWTISVEDQDYIQFVGEDDALCGEITGERVTVRGLKATATDYKAKITVTAEGGERDEEGNNIATAECAVTVTPPVGVTGITLSATTLNLVSARDINRTATLIATITPANATNRNVTWTITPKTAEDAGCVARALDLEADFEDNDDHLIAAFRGVSPGTATITATTADGKFAECVVTVTAPVAVTDVTMNRSELSMSAGTTATLTATVRPGDATNKNVKWVVAEGGQFVSLSAEETLSGNSVTITARQSGTATITAYSEEIPNLTAKCEITITAPRIEGYSLGSNDRLEFSGSGLLSTLRSYCRNITGSSLSYLTNISVSTTAGTLYEGYVSEADHGEGVSTSVKYYDSSTGVNQLSKMVFVPRSGFTGNATISFTAYPVSGDPFTGSIVINIPDNPLTYTAENGLPVCFKASDFTNYSLTRGYSTIKYVRFYELPSSIYGALYLNYIDSDINEGRVSSSTAYYRTGSPSLDKVWFVPNPTYSGSITIPFEACDTSGVTFNGSLIVQIVNVEGSSGVASNVSYSVRPGETVWFNTNDFNDLCYDRTDYPLNYLYFSSLPTSSRGTLYCSGYGSVSTSQYIYRSGSNRRLLFDVYFTARNNYSGTLSIPFTAYATNGRSFRGTVTITVSSSAGSTGSVEQNTIYDTGSMITYSSGGEAVAFRSQDFYNEAARYLSNPLSTVEFYTPDAAQGRLCLNYSSPTSYSILDSSVAYPYATTSLISFLPRAGFSGAAYIRFVATDVSGKGYTGTLAVNVTPPAYSSYFNDLNGYSWAVPATDFLARYGIVNGVDYRTFSPTGLTKRGDFILMLQRCFVFQSVGDVPVFADVPAWSYYGPAIAGAYVAGLVTGDGDGTFRPEAALTRQEAAVLLYRCMRRSGSLPGVTAADLEGFADRAQIAPYAQTAVATLTRLGVLTGSGGYLNPAQNLTRAEMALMFYRALT